MHHCKQSCFLNTGKTFAVEEVGSLLLGFQVDFQHHHVYIFDYVNVLRPFFPFTSLKRDLNYEWEIPALWIRFRLP